MADKKKLTTVNTTNTTTTYGRNGVSEATGRALQGYESGYKPSAAVTGAQKYLQQMQNNKPGDYTSPYAGQLDDLYNQISGRKPFSYDLNADMLYRQYRDQYQNLGQQAMMDTMGQAAGLTGGYGSSYSQNAGQQAYNSYLQQLNDKVPELYQLALNKYQMEGDDLLNQYGLLNDRENTAYNRYRDAVGDYQNDLALAYQQYQDERGFDYGQWGDMLNYWQDKANRENSDWWQQTEFDYQKERDAVADDQWERQFAASQAARGGGGGGGYGSDYQALLDYIAQLERLGLGGEYSLGKNGSRVRNGTNQGNVEIPGYGTVNTPMYLQMLRQGMINKDGTMKKAPTSGSFRMLK